MSPQPSSSNTSLLRYLSLFSLVLGLAAVAHAEPVKPKVVGVLFYANWCSSCKTLDPKIDAIKKDFAGQPILFTRVDFTDNFTLEQSDLLAAAMNLGPAYAEQRRRTGFMLLIDAETKQVLGRLAAAQTETDLKAAIEKALRS